MEEHERVHLNSGQLIGKNGDLPQKPRRHFDGAAIIGILKRHVAGGRGGDQGDGAAHGR